MKSIRYTIRNIPEPVDRYLRNRAKLSGKSLNQVILEELSEQTGVSKSNTSLVDSLDWFIGSGMDDETVKVLEEEDKIQKERAKEDFKKGF